MKYNEVILQIDSPDGNRELLSRYQNTQDIVKDLIYCFKFYNKQALPVAKANKTGDVEKDGKAIWQFIKDNIHYIAEPERDQTTRSFSRIIHDKEGDCKHSALIVGSIAWNEGYNVIFRFVSYKAGTSFGHVYTIIQDPKTGKAVIVDPLQDFNTEKSFVSKKDFYALQPKSKEMALSRLTGLSVEQQREQKIRNELAHSHRKPYKRIHTNNPERLRELEEMRHREGRRESNPEQSIEQKHVHLPTRREFHFTSAHDELGEIGRRTKKQRQADRASRKEKRKERGGAFKMIALAPVRGAMSALLTINAFDFARRLKIALGTNPGEVKALAKKLGYKFNVFERQINTGAGKKAIGDYESSSIGFVLATAAAIAAPAIILTVTLLKKLGLISPKDAAIVDTATAQAAAMASGDPTAGGAITPQDMQNMAEAGADTGIAPGRGKGKPMPGGEGFMNKKMFGLPAPLLLIGGAAAIFMLTKKS